MQKRYCDKCGDEVKEYSYVRVGYSDKESIINNVNAYKDLCPLCKIEFIKMVEDFLPDFFVSAPHQPTQSIRLLHD